PVTGQVRFGIYGDTGATYPGNLIIETTPQNTVASSWNTASLPNVYLPAGTYWMAFEFSNTTFINSNTSGGTYYWFANGWSVLADTFTGALTSFPKQMSIYLTTCP
ncbi:MAG TPA: hypothetical protein VIJ93_07460, partial [bacterium]